jgi:hypothetical protein
MAVNSLMENRQTKETGPLVGWSPESTTHAGSPLPQTILPSTAGNPENKDANLRLVMDHGGVSSTPGPAQHTTYSKSTNTP